MPIVPQPEFPKRDLNTTNAIILPEVIDIAAINGLARERADYQLPLFQLAQRALDAMKLHDAYGPGDLQAFVEGIETINVIAYAVNNRMEDPRVIALTSWRKYLGSRYSDDNKLSERIPQYATIKRNTFDTVLRISQKYPPNRRGLQFRTIGAQIGDELLRGEY